jgi:FKBP-type peptidyl-prolyl cis-trans isomerase
MNTVSTGIAVALALVIMAFFFLPGLFPFGVGGQAAPDTSGATLDIASTTDGAPVAAAGEGDATTNQAAMDTTGVQTTADGLGVKDIVTGTGPAAKAGDTVTVNYVGMLTDGTVFDASANHGSSGFTFTLGAGQVIKGWDEGVAGMQAGGKRELVIPAALAYGDQGAGSAIPPNATLIFEVELVSIGQ